MLIAPYSLYQPVFTPQALHALELAQIACDNDQASAARMAGDHQIVGADYIAPPLQIAPYLGCMGRRLAVEGQHSQSGCKMLNLTTNPRRIIRTFSAIEQFIEHHIREGQSFGIFVEARPQNLNEKDS